ncbi:hypothetical protein HRG_000842 [Hirsutella rhossiliensis]|uniref:Uncharacterized protein n=1 Tax=Hirsutella rhossiliensis TaxID=111463 RepID=A0A9P8N7E4_9HYPO|nr:uncharacterized protein HRG_00842 [Hirsutella rhossiliensis]KAH0968200.1 hypothetical protein HRG_00842 [Hirsutella rhossiliensis]
MDRIKAGVGFVKAKATSSREYSMIAKSDGDDELEYEHQEIQNKGPQRRWLPLTTSFLLGVFIMAVVSVAWDLTSLRKSAAANRKIPQIRQGTDAKTGLPLSWSHGDCGNSPADAQTLGCRYSIVLHAWLPRDCLTDDDLADEGLMYRGRDWPYETDGKNLTMDELRGGRYHHFTTTFDWHVTHCMYVWKRLHRVMLDATQKLDSYTANFHHTGHCVKMIGGGSGHQGMKNSGTKIFVKYPVCA